MVGSLEEMRVEVQEGEEEQEDNLEEEEEEEEETLQHNHSQ